MVYRIYVAKKTEFANEANALLGEIKNLLKISGVESLSVINRYDVENIDKTLFDKCINSVFSEPQIDDTFVSLPNADYVFAVEPLPGQFDQRADSAAQCVQLFSAGNRPTVKTAKVYAINGKLSKEELFDIYEEYDCFIGTDEGDALYGCGTYNLPIYSSKDSTKMAYNLWMFDSNTYDEELGGYDYVHDDQVEWYVNKSNELKAANGGEAVPSMAFQHIIVKEIFDLIESGDNIEGSMLNYDGKDYVFKEGVLKAGYLKEYPCPGTRPSKQFGAMVEQGDVVAMFFGHDHNNSFEVNHSGIDLVATPGFTFNSYGNEDRGVRIIDINENDTSTYETRLVQFDDYFADNKMAMANYNMNCDYLPLWDRIKAGIFFVLTFLIKAIFGYAF
jgi:hypothetical protein